MFVDPNKPHLGGFCEGQFGDEATYFPDLWKFLCKELEIKSVIDIGCGTGVSTKFFEGLLGLGNVLGIDGVPQEHPSIVEHDYTLGPFPVRERDLVWCSELLEHIEERFLLNVLSTLTCGNIIALTHAFPGQQGYHHVLCKEPQYWVGVLAAVGYRLDEDLTKQAKNQAAKNKSEWNHFVRSGMVFVKY